MLSDSSRGKLNVDPRRDHESRGSIMSNPIFGQPQLTNLKTTFSAGCANCGLEMESSGSGICGRFPKRAYRNIRRQIKKHLKKNCKVKREDIKTREREKFEGLLEATKISLQVLEDKGIGVAGILRAAIVEAKNRK